MATIATACQTISEPVHKCGALLSLAAVVNLVRVEVKVPGSGSTISKITTVEIVLLVARWTKIAVSALKNPV